MPEKMECELCETAAAEVIKLETESSYDEQSNEHRAVIRVKICKACAELYYDGTEDHPGTLPL